MSPKRTLWTDLRAVDQAIVPRIARLLGRTRRALRDLGPTVDAGRDGPVATLSRLDERYAARGTLGLVRDVPQVAAAGLAALLVVAASTVLVRVGGSGADAGDADPSAVHRVTVGPFPGEMVSGYIEDARARLARAAVDAPDRPLFAIADFESGVSPAEAAAALPRLVPERLFIRVRAQGANSRLFEERIGALPGGATTVFVNLAGRLEQSAAVLERQAKTITGKSPGDLAEKASEKRDARRQRAQADRLRFQCACIVAVVVRGPAYLLADTANSGSVRLIDPAGAGLSARSVTWVPLLPEVTKRVPVPNAPPNLPTRP